MPIVTFISKILQGMPKIQHIKNNKKIHNKKLFKNISSTSAVSFNKRLISKRYAIIKI